MLNVAIFLAVIETLAVIGLTILAIWLHRQKHRNLND